MSDEVCSRLQQQEVHSVVFGSKSPDLDGLTVEILSRLPAKSLIRFRCVCKAWRALISDPYFIRKHLSRINTKISTSYSLLLREQVFQSIEYEAILKCLSHDDPLPSRRLDFPVLDLLLEIPHVVIAGSCNGLVCLVLDVNAKGFHTIMVWNPCTGEFQVLPPLEFRDNYFWGFGYDSTIDDYKVVLGSCEAGHEVIFVYELKSGSWRKLEKLNRYFGVHWVGCLVNQALHWILKEMKDGRLFALKLVSFDLAEEKFHEVPSPFLLTPEHMLKFTVKVGVLRNCLTLSFQANCCQPVCNLKMWVLKDYGGKESWTEVVNIPVLDSKYIYKTCISENGEVLMRFDGALVLYNPKEKTFKIVMNFSTWYETATYIETLVSPLTGSTGASE